jgi:hypothetical protein
MRWVMLVCALASTARADGAYFSESAGGVAPGDQGAAVLPRSGAQAEIHLGVRMGNWGVELQLITDNFEPYAGSPQTANLFAVGLGARYVQPISRHFSMYLRGRAMRGWAGDALDGYAGNGLGVGAGFQLEGHTKLGRLPIAGALLFEADEDFYRFHDAYEPSLDTTLSALEFGIALGTDF